MLVLPKANPLKEHIPAAKVFVPEILRKLSTESFNGYLEYFAPPFKSYCLYADGKMICAASENNGVRQTGFSSIKRMFEVIAHAEGEISIYRMTPDMVLCAHALMLGARLYSREDIRQLDLKTVFAELKEARLKGVVRFSTPERYAMIFFKDGNPLGFYHDGASTIESSPEESRKVAALPGAVLDVFSTENIEQAAQHDILHMLKLEELWEATRKAASESIDTGTVHGFEQTHVPDISSVKIEELIDDLQEVAAAYLSKSGSAVVHKCFAAAGGPELLLDDAKIDAFLELIRKHAVEIDSDARIEEMIELMKSEITSRFRS